MLTGLVVVVGLLSHISTTFASNVVYNHDCLVGSPPTCNNSLANDPLCRGLYSSDIKAWQNNNCDYVVYDVKAEVPSDKFVVIHAGDCDEGTEWLGDWLYGNTGYNLFGLRPCTGMDSQTCVYNRSTCDAIHLSWTAWNGVPGNIGGYGLGFNPPALLDYAKDPNNSFVFIHSYDGLPDYPWAGACNRTHPSYICISSAEDDASFERKFNGDSESPGIKSLFESFSNTEYVPCTVEAIDARNSSSVPGVAVGTYFGEKEPLNRYANLPCSGLYPQAQFQGFTIEFQATVAQGIYTAILHQEDGNGTSPILDAFQQAIEISLGD